MKLIVTIALLLGIVVWSYADYKAPSRWVEVADRVATNVEEGVELQARMVDGKPNPLFTVRRNAYARIWTKDADNWEVVWRHVGVPASEMIVATGTSSCKPLERQPVAVWVVLEEPNMNEPVNPAVEVIP